VLSEDQAKKTSTIVAYPKEEKSDERMIGAVAK